MVYEMNGDYECGRIIVRVNEDNRRRLSGSQCFFKFGDICRGTDFEQVRS